MRVPCLARWPGKVPAGTTTEFPSAFWDIIPTLSELTGAAAPSGLDGVSILPTLLGQPAKQMERDYLYWEAAPRQALRRGEWKAYRDAPNKPIELYNLANDIGETRNVAAENPEVAAALTRLLSQAHVDSPEFPLVPKGKKAKQE